MRLRATTPRGRLLGVLGLSLVPALAPADQEGRLGPYKIEAADGRHVFVMARSCWYGDLREEPIEGYIQSGLYRNDGSRTPLWTVEWCSGVLLPSDGVHLVRAGPWAAWYGEEAFTFFSRGRLLRSYAVRDLVDWPWLLPHTVSHFSWLRSVRAEGGPDVYPLASGGGATLRAGAPASLRHPDRIRVETLHGDTFVFALQTGEIVSSRRPVRTVVRLLGAAFAAACLVLVALASRRRPRWSGVGILRGVYASVALGWAVPGLGLLLARALFSSECIAAATLSFSCLTAMALWRLVVVLPYEWATWRLGGEPMLIPGVFGLVLAFAFWFAVTAVAGAVGVALVALVAAARGRASGEEPAYVVPVARRALDTLTLLMVCVASLWLLDAAFQAEGLVAVAFWFASVAMPLALVALHQLAWRRRYATERQDT